VAGRVSETRKMGWGLKMDERQSQRVLSS
jgi:hypothetical protein